MKEQSHRVLEVSEKRVDRTHACTTRRLAWLQLLYRNWVSSSPSLWWPLPRLNTRTAHLPVNATLPPSRTAPHDSGPVWLATSSLCTYSVHLVGLTRRTKGQEMGWLKKVLLVGGLLTIVPILSACPGPPAKD